MGASLAILICSVGIAFLFYLNRDKSVRNSQALWLPVIWMWINGSRPVSAWFGGGVNLRHILTSTLEGSPTDAAIYAVLLAIGVVVLLGRRKKTIAYLSVIGPITVFFIYCLISVTWSPFHDAAFKRWTKAVGDLVMVLVVVTDPEPLGALRRLYSRVGFILLPLSVVLIRWTTLGRGFDPEGNPSNTGVTTNKNSLGLVVYVIALGALWNVCSLLIHKDEPNRTRKLVAQVTLLAFGLALLETAHSSTSIACFVLGGGLILAGSLPAIRRRPARLNSLFLLIVLAGGLTFLSGGEAWVTQALGRKPDLSGRTDIWKAVSTVAGTTLIGEGFESFWNAKALDVNIHLHQMGFMDQSNLVSAHNGYLEVYVDLGLIGVCLLALILISGFRRACKAVERDPQLGSLFLAYIATGAIYSVTEAGFRMLTPTWIFLLLAIICASGVSAGFFGGPTPQIRTSRSAPVSETPPAMILTP